MQLPSTSYKMFYCVLWSLELTYPKLATWWLGISFGKKSQFNQYGAVPASTSSAFMNNEVDKWVLPQVADWNTTEHRNCFFIFVAENGKDVFGKSPNCHLFPSPPWDAIARLGFHRRSQRQFCSVTPACRSSDTRQSVYQQWVGFNFQSLDFNKPLEKYSCDFSPQTETGRAAESSHVVCSLYSVVCRKWIGQTLLQMCISGMTRKQVTLLSLEYPPPDHRVYLLYTKARLPLAHLRICHVYFSLSNPPWQKNQRGFSSFPYPCLPCLAVLMSDNASWFFFTGYCCWKLLWCTGTLIRWV